MQSPFVRRLFAMGLGGEYRRVKRRLKRDPTSLTLQLQEAILHAIVEDRGSFLHKLKNIVARHQESEHQDDLRLLYAITLQQEGSPEDAKREIRQFVYRRIAEKDSWKRLGESANRVIEYTPKKFVRNIIVIKEGRRDEINGEARMTASLDELLNGHARYKMVEVLATVDEEEATIGKEEKSYLVMKRQHGKLLAECRETKTYLLAADFLAYLHAKADLSLSRKGDVAIAFGAKSRLENEHLGLPRQIMQAIMRHYRPVYDAIMAMPRGINCDAHPENFMALDDGSMLALDKPDKGIIPIGLDVANLCMGRADKDAIIDAYYDSFRRYHDGDAGDLLDKETFRLGCYNSIIHRAIVFLAAWSSSDRPSMHVKRRWACELVADSVIRIRRYFPVYYGKHDEAYKTQQAVFKRIKGSISGIMIG